MRARWPAYWPPQDNGGVCTRFGSPSRIVPFLPRALRAIYSARGNRRRAAVGLVRLQDRRTVVVLDEFEKLKDLTSALGWDQAR